MGPVRDLVTTVVKAESAVDFQAALEQGVNASLEVLKAKRNGHPAIPFVVDVKPVNVYGVLYAVVLVGLPGEVEISGSIHTESGY